MTTRRTALKRIGLVLLVLVAGGGWWTAKLLWFRPLNIDHFFERAFIEFGLKNPELLSELRVLEPFGLRFHNDDLTPASEAFALELVELAERDLAILQGYDPARLTESQRLSATVLEWFLTDRIEAGRRWRHHDYPVNQSFGVQNGLPTFMATIHQVHDRTDAEHYRIRLSKFPRKFDEVLDGLRRRESLGVIPPTFIIDRVLAEMRAFVAQPVEENILYTSFVEKVENAEELPPSAREELLRGVREEIVRSVYPSYHKLIAHVEALLPKSTADAGVWKLPEGDAYYAYALRSHTTTSMSADEIHALGLREVARVQAEMTAMFDDLGIAGETVADRVAILDEDAGFYYPDTDEGRAQCLADYQAIIDEIDAGLDAAFDLRPAIGVRVERVPEFREAGAAGAYYNSPALDGSRPGIFYANLRDMSEVAKYGMRTLAYHEAIPGHHFQLAIQQKLPGPTFRKVLPFTAYVEGWALYAERLAWELGFQDDPHDNIGRLQAELFRAVRLVVDTGIHHKRWSREQAIAYMEEHTGMPHGDVVAEIERYIVNPGQACAYKVGQLTILELRERARTALGDRFDLRAFHNVLLRNGALPLEILEQEVERYLAEAQSAAAA